MADDKLTTQTNGSGDDDAEAREAEGSEDEGSDFTDLVESFEYYFDRPVAVQLKHPVVRVDNLGPRVQVPTGEGDNDFEVLGVPQLIPDKAGNIEATPMLAGVLLPSECGTRLLLRMRGRTGALIETSIEPEHITNVTLILEPGKEPPTEADRPLIYTPRMGGSDPS